MRQRLHSLKFLALVMAIALIVAVLLAILDRSYWTALGLVVFGSVIVAMLLLVVRRERTLRREAQRVRRTLLQRAADAGVSTVAEDAPAATSIEARTLLGHATGEDPAQRARALEQVLHQDRPMTIGAIVGDALGTRLRAQSAVIDLLPGLGIRQLPGHVGCLVIDETSFESGGWEGVLDARHTMKFLDLRMLLLAAQGLNIPVLLIQHDHASHHSADLSALADTTVSNRGVLLVGGGRVPTAVRDTVMQVKEEAASS